MKKKYMKPQMQVHQLMKMNLLTGSKGVYGKIGDGVTQKEELKYGGYVESEDDEDNYDPD